MAIFNVGAGGGSANGVYVGLTEPTDPRTTVWIVPDGTPTTPEDIAKALSISTDTASSITGLLKGNGGNVAAAVAGTDYTIPPASANVLPASGTALTANTIYVVATAVGTYAFTPPATGWAHGMFTTDSSVSVSFSGTFMGAAPTIEASKIYEFDVFDGVWAVQEVVSA